ncbi:unnamed protein product [Rhodiola kirilowii]
MAEALGAGVAIATAVLTLGQFLQQQASFLFNIRDKIEWLKKELISMQSFLQDAEKKLDNDDSSIRVWVSDLRDLAYECEDAIDTFLLKLSCMREPQPGCTGTMSRCFVAYTAKFRSTYELGCQIEKLMKKVTDISSRRQRYRLDATDVSSTSDSREKKLMQLRRSAPYANNELMVGLGETISLLEGKLTEGGSGRFVISILGMGGLGKTTLARKLYNSLRQRYFESYSWVCVSQEYNTRDILLDLIKSMVKPEPTKKDLERMTTKHSMEAYLRTWLTGRRFLVVIDDVWEREAWESLERAFPDNNKSSRVIITTRKKHVATLNTAYVHELRYLQEDESWELFCKKAFPDDNEIICPPNLERLGREMVTKCSGLPLAIITLGGLLSTKSQVLSEWETVRDNLWKELKKDSVHINPVLLLSYNDLPQNLKPCFLYVGMFPEDFEIELSELIWKWVAEGFIGQEEEGSPEDTAKYYFNELVGRSLIQKKGEDWIDSNCRVHDLLRDMAIRKAKEMCFSLYYDEKTTSKLSKAVPHRRLSYMSCDKIPSSYINPSLRTLCQRNAVTDGHPNRQWNTAPEKMLQSLFECFGLLRVFDIQVDFSRSLCFEIPGEIGKLVHLRYLGLYIPPHTKVEFPETISNLKALETLLVRSNAPVTLPKTMVKLKNLRHLIGRSTGDWIGKLTGLETLGGVSYNQWCGIDTTYLVNLRYLGVANIPQNEANPTKFYDKFKSLTMLQTLALYCQDDSALGCISASEIFKRCHSITHFFSSGMSYNQSADLHEFAVNLQVLEMVFYDHQHDPIPSIKNLPKLRALRIKVIDGIDGWLGGRLICSEGGFTQLRTLKIEIHGGCEFVVKEGSLPSLTHLEVNNPERIIAPDTLKQLISKTSWCSSPGTSLLYPKFK